MREVASGGVDVELLTTMSWISRICSGGAITIEAIGALVGDDFVAHRGAGGRGRDAHLRPYHLRTAGAAPPILRGHELIDLGREFAGKRELERNHDDRLLLAAHVERADYLEQSLDVVGVVGDDHGVVAGKCRDQAVVRNHRLDHADDGSGVDILKPHHPGDVLIAAGSAAGSCDSVSAGDRAHVARRLNLDDLAGLNGGEAFDLEHRLKDRVGLLGSDLARRDDRNLAAHGFVDDEVAAGDLGDELGENGNIHVLKVHRNRVLRRQPCGFGSKGGGSRIRRGEQQCGGQRPKQKTAHASILRILGQNDGEHISRPARSATRNCCKCHSARRL